MKADVEKTSQKAPNQVPAGNFDTFMETLGQKDRRNIERHLGLCASDLRHVKLWTRVVSVLTALAPDAVQTSGNFAAQFFVAEGKYRLQVFALEDPRNGALQLYTPNVLDEAVRSGVLGRATPAEGEAKLYAVRGGDGATLRIEPLTAAKTTAAPEFYKHMLGWNRKAIRITLPSTASEAEIHAAEMLCVLAAKQLSPKPAAARAAQPAKSKA